MDDDIVAVLANMAIDHGRYRTHHEGCHKHHLECAALIVCAEIERLRAAGDALAEALSAWIDGMDAFPEDQDRLDAWQEARRG